MIELLLLLFALALILVCGAFVAAEFSFVTVDRSAVERATKAGDRRAAGVESALGRLSTHLSAAQIGITVTNLIIGFLAEPSIARLIDGPLEAAGVRPGAVPGVAVAIGFVIANGLTMVLGELVPKNLAIARPLAVARAVQGFQRGFTAAVRPLVTVGNGIANRILTRLGAEPQEELASARSPEELGSLVRRSAIQGTLAASTAELLQKSLLFGDRRADDVMTPRVKVTTVAPDDPVSAVVNAARESGRSRFPVVADGSELVEGIVHIKHAVEVPHELRERVPARDLMVDPVLVPSTLELDPLMAELRKTGLQMAVVVDEFGGFDGIVTLEDLVEEIVGEVRDEHDLAEVEPVVRIGVDVWRLSGLVRPDELADETGVILPENEDYETVAGLIGFELGRVPGRGDVLTIPATDTQHRDLLAELAVLRMDDLRVDLVRLELIGPRPVEEEQS